MEKPTLRQIFALTVNKKVQSKYVKKIKFGNKAKSRTYYFCFILLQIKLDDVFKPHSTAAVFSVTAVGKYNVLIIKLQLFVTRLAAIAR